MNSGHRWNLSSLHEKSIAIKAIILAYPTEMP
jgi:hypothetical protein